MIWNMYFQHIKGHTCKPNRCTSPPLYRWRCPAILVANNDANNALIAR